MNPDCRLYSGSSWMFTLAIATIVVMLSTASVSVEMATVGGGWRTATHFGQDRLDFVEEAIAADV